jgi:hypothetical protein
VSRYGVPRGLTVRVTGLLAILSQRYHRDDARWSRCSRRRLNLLDVVSDN